MRPTPSLVAFLISLPFVLLSQACAYQADSDAVSAKLSEECHILPATPECATEDDEVLEQYLDVWIAEHVHTPEQEQCLLDMPCGTDVDGSVSLQAFANCTDEGPDLTRIFRPADTDCLVDCAWEIHRCGGAECTLEEALSCKAAHEACRSAC